MTTYELCDWSECASMNRAGTMFSESLQMIFSPIPLMGKKIINGIGQMVHRHHAISRDFGHNRRGSNGQRQGITLYD